MTDATAQPDPASSEKTQPYPTAKAGWFMVAMLTSAYVLSYIDRSIIGLLIEPIKVDLGLTDADVGYILGPAFAIIYVAAGLPLGWLVDRKRRTWIVGFGVIVWSLATAVCGLAKNFWQLFLARMTVGAGEAVLSPSAMSMISDSFPPERRGKPIAVYVGALSLGAAIASLIGGGVTQWAKTTDNISVPLLGELAPWQLTFVAVGLPGLILAVIFFIMHEPPRRPHIAAKGEEDVGNGIGDALGYVGRNIGPYAGFISLACAMTICAYSQGFLPSVFARSFGWETETYAYVNAVVIICAGPPAVFAAGWLSDRWAQAGRNDAPLLLLVIGFVLMVPTAVLPMFMPSGELAFVFLFFNTSAIGIISAMALNALLAITPGQVRGQITALYYIVISMSGLFIGPTTVGVLSTYVFGEENLNYAFAATCCMYAIVQLLLLPVIIKSYKRQLAKVTGQEAAEA